MITEKNISMLLEGWQNLTNKQYDDASKGIGRIDRNGDYHAKKEVTAKTLKKQKASDRIKAEADLAIGAFKNVEAAVIKSANSVYAGKNNVAKIEADPDARKSYSSRAETSYSGKGFRVDPMYLYVLVTDTNGNKAHVRVDSRPSLNKDVYVEKEDGCSISDEYLDKIGNSIVNFMHRKIRTRYENSKRYGNDIREKIARHHRNSSYPNGYTKGAEHELRRREYLGEDVLEEGPALQMRITTEAKPFLQKHGIKFDLSNYQNDGYLKAGGYKFWYDDNKDGFMTNEPRYSGRRFADITELLAYALNIKAAKEEFKKFWGDQAYAARSRVNSSIVTEGSHHAKYSPAINYKNVNNYIIKARKALKDGNYDEAEKWAWEAQETMHEDEMQGPGVAADKNAYNIYKKQVMNIYDAVRKAKGNK